MRASVVSAVMLFGLTRGISLDEMTAATGISLGDLVDPEARLPDHVLASAWRLIGARCPNQAVALEMAAVAPMSIFGPLAQAARFSPTRRDALQSFCRYDKVLSGGLDITVIEGGETISMVLRHALDDADNGYGAEAALALGARVGNEILGLDESVRRVEFAHAANAPAALYEDWFGVPVRFSAGRTAVVFDTTLMASAPAQTNHQMHAYIQAHLDLVEKRLLSQIRDAPLDRVRAAIATQAARSDYGAESIAKQVGMSVRSLQRYTTKNGASLRTLIEQAREANARRLLSDDRLSVDEVAFLLGYSDDRAFRRAFKRWTSATPAAFRAAQG